MLIKQTFSHTICLAITVSARFPITTLTRISTSGETLQEALSNMTPLVPEGMVLVLAYSRSDHGQSVFKESGESDEIAIRKVETRLPRNAKVLSKRLITKSTSRVIQVSVNGGLKEALEEARFLISPTESVRSGKLLTPASSGIFGVGAKKAVYAVTVGINAVAEVLVEVPVDLTGCVGSPQLKAVIDGLKTWYQESAAKNHYLFLPDKLCKVCGKPLKGNPYLTPKHVLCENCVNVMLGTTNWPSALKHLNLDFGPGVPQELIKQAEALK